jgi:hypothetical protein
MSLASETVPIGEAPATAKRTAVRERWHSRINRAAGYFEFVGLGWLIPLVRIALGDDVRQQGVELWRQLCVPLIAIVLFLGAWHGLHQVHTVWIVARASGLARAQNRDHAAERDKRVRSPASTARNAGFWRMIRRPR